MSRRPVPPDGRYFVEGVELILGHRVTAQARVVWIGWGLPVAEALVKRMRIGSERSEWYAVRIVHVCSRG